jgi:hypothetical protein
MPVAAAAYPGMIRVKPPKIAERVHVVWSKWQ